MYEEIDTSGQTKWILPTVLGFVFIVGLSIVRFFMMPLGDPPFNDDVDLVAIIGFTPFVSCLVGSIFGMLRKRSTTINPDRLEFTSDVRDLDEFGKVYYEGDFRTGELGGNPPYMCGWAISVLLSMILGFMLLFGISTIGLFIGSIIEVGLVAIMYIAGVYFAFRGGPIRNPMVKDPLHFRITKYLSKYDVLTSMNRCDLISKIIVKYKVGKGQILKVIHDIHVFAVTTTEPALEVEVTIKDMEDIGPEYTYYLPETQATRKEERIDVAGKEVMVIQDEVDMKSFIRMRYDTGMIKARWNLGTPERLCDLMHAIVEEIAKSVPVRKIPKKNNDSSVIV